MGKRYIEGGYGLSEMEEDEQGDWVSYGDYAKFESEIRELRQQLSRPAPDAAGWIEWRGGKRPVISGKQVEVKFRGGEGCIALSGELDWRDTESCGDIIAYRVVS